MPTCLYDAAVIVISYKASRLCTSNYSRRSSRLKQGSLYPQKCPQIGIVCGSMCLYYCRGYLCLFINGMGIYIEK